LARGFVSTAFQRRERPIAQGEKGPQQTLGFCPGEGKGRSNGGEGRVTGHASHTYRVEVVIVSLIGQQFPDKFHVASLYRIVEWAAWDR